MFIALCIAVPLAGALVVYPAFRRLCLQGAALLALLALAAYLLMSAYQSAQHRRPWSLLVDLPGQFDINAPLYSSRNAPHDRLRAFPTYEACLAAGQELHPLLLRRYKARDIVMQCQQQ